MTRSSPSSPTHLLDRKSGIRDQLGVDVGPEDLSLVGLSHELVESYAANMFCTADDYRSSCFEMLNIDRVDDSSRGKAIDLLERGKQWWFGPLESAQPRCHAFLMGNDVTIECGFHVFWSDGRPGRVGPTPLFLELLHVAGRAIRLVPYHHAGWSPEFIGTDDRFDCGAWPEFLLRSWWYRMAGYQILRSIPWPAIDLAQPLLQWPGQGTGFNDLLAGLGPAFKRKYLPMYKERFGADAVTKIFDVGRVAFRCFIDTRPPETNGRPCGDQLFIHMGRSDKVVYHVHQARFEELRYLAPEHLPECFDRYFLHVLSRQPGEFDFMPYSRKL